MRRDRTARIRWSQNLLLIPLLAVGFTVLVVDLVVAPHLGKYPPTDESPVPPTTEPLRPYGILLPENLSANVAVAPPPPIVVHHPATAAAPKDPPPPTTVAPARLTFTASRSAPVATTSPPTTLRPKAPAVDPPPPHLATLPPIVVDIPKVVVMTTTDPTTTTRPPPKVPALHQPHQPGHHRRSNRHLDTPGPAGG